MGVRLRPLVRRFGCPVKAAVRIFGFNAPFSVLASQLSVLGFGALVLGSRVSVRRSRRLFFRFRVSILGSRFQVLASQVMSMSALELCSRSK